jgi:hypothetical protein
MRFLETPYFGQRVLQEVSDESELLLAKELSLQSELETEEQSLTVKRKTIGTEEFKNLQQHLMKKYKRLDQKLQRQE